MPWTSAHIKWLVNTGQTIKTADGKDIAVFEFRYQNDAGVLSAWAKHFRNHYCLDTEIDALRNGTGLTRAEYLIQMKFPDSAAAPGPSIRSGDFGEIIISDYIEHVLNYWVPRTRYIDKAVRNESTKGCDMIGFRVLQKNIDSAIDTLIIFESKAQLTGNDPKPRLQDAVNDSIKDITRKPESLNAIKQRLYSRQQTEQIWKVERFQNPTDHPYQEIFGAAAIFSASCCNLQSISLTDASNHPKSNLNLIVIRGKDLMDLVHELYKRAANEA
jgi:hypothetical protein